MADEMDFTLHALSGPPPGRAAEETAAFEAAVLELSVVFNKVPQSLHADTLVSFVITVLMNCTEDPEAGLLYLFERLPRVLASAMATGGPNAGFNQ